MNTFTAAADPQIERVISSHMRRIVEAIRSGMEPEAILLRGSFGKGEGDVLIENRRLKFLSDYEINVATLSFRYRGYFKRVADRLSAELGVETSLVWMRPDYFYKLRVGPFVAGSVPTTISLYETRYGSQVLYGRDLLRSAPEVDPTCITMESGMQLMLNRMAEAVHFLPEPDGRIHNEWQSIYWMNKLILACVESLLLSWGQYHYSYRERGKRFSFLAKDRLDFMGEEGQTLYRFAQRATEFKMRPRRELYPAALQSTAREVVYLCGAVFAHLASKEWGVRFDDAYPPYAEEYLRVQMDRLAPLSYQRGLYKLRDVYKYLRARRTPLNLLSPNTAGDVIYSVVPMLFAGWAVSDSSLPPIIQVTRHQMRKVGTLPVPAPTARAEWRQLCEQMLVSWKNFCT